MNDQLKIHDVTLRDGSHALFHQLRLDQVETYATAINQSGVHFVEVGHGNGLGASSWQIGRSLHTDQELIQTAKRCLTKAKLAVHVIPGCATIKKDILPALACGVEVFRIASHCTEADVTQTHINYLKEKQVEVYGVLMMSHMASVEQLLEQSLKLQSYGAKGVILMDSAGAYLPHQVHERVQMLKQHLSIEIGFHAHHNLGLAVANALVAVEAGATIIDGSARGFGAGAGNCPIEILVSVLQKKNLATSIDLYAVLEAAEIAEKILIEELPFSKTMSITTGLAGIFSGFAKPIQKLCKGKKMDPKKVVFELGKRGVIAGQEDMIEQVIEELS